MRTRMTLQTYLRFNKPETLKAELLEEMDAILMLLPGISAVYDAVIADVTRGSSVKLGADGLTAEQIVRLAILRVWFDFSYRDLSEQTGDSISINKFLNLAPGKKISKSAINKNLKLLSASTLTKINDCIKNFAKQENIDDGTVIRADTTATETNIHYPSDASLLYDCVFVLTRTLNRLQMWCSAPIASSDHCNRAKRRLYKINNSRKEKDRHDNYLELIRVTRMTLGYAENALPVIENFSTCSSHALFTLMSLESELKHYIPLAKRVIDQAHRRIVKGEKVPAKEKLFSIFETATDIIIKGQREVVFGHKILITTGKSSLITQIATLDGNPADSSLIKDVLNNHKDFYGSAPTDVATDGGFASVANRNFAKKLGVENITFSKNGKMSLETLVSSKAKHKMLMNFRAGIEGCISLFKRVFGGERILDRSKKTFEATIQCVAVAFNLTLLARLRTIKSKT